MGLAFLPWEKLPAYVLGPLLFLLFSYLLWSDDHRTFGHTALEIGGIIFAVYIVWRRYRTGKELFAEEKREGQNT
ncbi:hypothetical protein [Roseateles chitosanitabidus]|uniref:hypothetical protein n=1 Tax=Roseateles chitosanitabidus TaxID=65048 RepID=UPI00083581E2|nr:hypothetical protein [Roseateles chitosanitabidus]